MISLLLLECAVMFPDGTAYDRFKAEDGWSIARLGPLQWRVNRVANEPQNIRAVPEVTLDGYAGVYVDGADDRPLALNPTRDPNGYGTSETTGIDAWARLDLGHSEALARAGWGVTSEPAADGAVGGEPPRADSTAAADSGAKPKRRRKPKAPKS